MKQQGHSSQQYTTKHWKQVQCTLKGTTNSKTMGGRAEPPRNHLCYFVSAHMFLTVGLYKVGDDVVRNVNVQKDAGGDYTEEYTDHTLIISKK